MSGSRAHTTMSATTQQFSNSHTPIQKTPDIYNRSLPVPHFVPNFNSVPASLFSHRKNGLQYLFSIQNVRKAILGHLSAYDTLNFILENSEVASQLMTRLDEMLAAHEETRHLDSTSAFHLNEYLGMKMVEDLCCEILGHYLSSSDPKWAPENTTHRLYTEPWRVRQLRGAFRMVSTLSDAERQQVRKLYRGYAMARVPDAVNGQIPVPYQFKVPQLIRQFESGELPLMYLHAMLMLLGRGDRMIKQTMPLKDITSLEQLAQLEDNSLLSERNGSLLSSGFEIPSVLNELITLDRVMYRWNGEMCVEDFLVNSHKMEHTRRPGSFRLLAFHGSLYFTKVPLVVMVSILVGERSYCRRCGARRRILRCDVKPQPYFDIVKRKSVPDEETCERVRVALDGALRAYFMHANLDSIRRLVPLDEDVQA